MSFATYRPAANEAVTLLLVPQDLMRDVASILHDSGDDGGMQLISPLAYTTFRASV
jgi:hypothetical protein